MFLLPPPSEDAAYLKAGTTEQIGWHNLLRCFVCKTSFENDALSSCSYDRDKACEGVCSDMPKTA